MLIALSSTATRRNLLECELALVKAFRSVVKYYNFYRAPVRIYFTCIFSGIWPELQHKLPSSVSYVNLLRNWENITFALISLLLSRYTRLMTLRCGVVEL